MDRAATRYAAPAKVNLGLRVQGKRSDGYHAIQTIFQMLDLCDWLTIQTHEADTLRLTCRPPTLPVDEDNLVVRAARLLQRAGNAHAGASIALDKHIPIAAGLGGGSSDAATTLLALNHLWDLHLPRATLHRLAAQLGSDVPFFLGGATALAEGRGEILKSLPPPPPLSGLIVNPGFGISAGWAYGQYASRPPAADLNMACIVQAVQAQNLSLLADLLINDLEPGVVAVYPVIHQMQEVLRAAGAVVTFMSGSGPSVCGIFSPCASLPSIAAALSRQQQWLVIPFRMRSHSPHPELQG
jgi:4-diphosphocytidyl-2-C-methyl-D-erythritol kinase